MLPVSNAEGFMWLLLFWRNFSSFFTSVFVGTYILKFVGV